MAAAARKKMDVRDKLLETRGEVDRPGKVCTGGDRPTTILSRVIELEKKIG